MIIGITGPNRSGKSEVAKILSQKGFKHYQVGDYINEQLILENKPCTRQNLIDKGNELRKNYGAYHIVYELYKKANGLDSIIESVRCPGEAIYLKNLDQFCLIGVTADPQIRWKRSLAKGDVKDNLTYGQFLEKEELEYQNTDPSKQNIKRCLELSDYLIKNETGMNDLVKNIDNVLYSIEKINLTPSTSNNKKGIFQLESF